MSFILFVLSVLFSFKTNDILQLETRNAFLILNSYLNSILKQIYNLQHSYYLNFENVIILLKRMLNKVYITMPACVETMSDEVFLNLDVDL